MEKIGTKNLYPVGFMGSGKDTVGGIVAARMGRKIVNTDVLIVEDQKMPINEIFDQRGEKHFRKVEAEIIKKVAGESNRVVSTGGGAFCQDRNRDVMLENGLVLWLDVDLPIIKKRLEKDTKRPLARNPLLFEKLFEDRRPLYARAHKTVRVDMEAPEEEIAERVLRAINWE